MSARELGWGAVICLAATLAVVGIAAFSEHWVMIFAFWQISFVGLAGLGVALWRRRQWWLLLTLPILLAPLVLGAGIIYACSQGDCL